MNALHVVISRFALDSYRIAEPEQLLTPSLLVYEAALEANIAASLALLDGQTERWRPHVKTAKLGWVMQRLLDHGIRQFKCATTLELATLCALGAPDVLLAFPLAGANARRVRELAARYPATRVSVLVDHPSQLDAWHGSQVGIFIDLNPGMDRTGAEASTEGATALARAVMAGGQPPAGLHWYDGQIGSLAYAEREAAAHRGYDRLLAIVATLERGGIRVPEVITSGTPALAPALGYAPFRDASFIHRVSPGTTVYGDLTSLSELPPEWGYRPAALVLAAVVSRPRPNRITCDGGHKAVSADAGVPTCGVLGHSDWIPAKPSEEHLPIDLPAGTALPAIGEYVYLLPRHVCPTVNNFDAAAIVTDGRVARIEPVTARGHETASAATPAGGSPRSAAA